MKLKEIERTAVEVWSPANNHPIYLATGKVLYDSINLECESQRDFMQSCVGKKKKKHFIFPTLIPTLIIS